MTLPSTVPASHHHCRRPGRHRRDGYRPGRAVRRRSRRAPDAEANLVAPGGADACRSRPASRADPSRRPELGLARAHGLRGRPVRRRRARVRARARERVQGRPRSRDLVRVRRRARHGAGRIARRQAARARHARARAASRASEGAGDGRQRGLRGGRVRVRGRLLAAIFSRSCRRARASMPSSRPRSAAPTEHAQAPAPADVRAASR